MSASKKEPEVFDLTMDDDDIKVSPTTTTAPIAAVPPKPPTDVVGAEVDQRRRSHRDHNAMSTIIYIDGHPIKKTNNYSVTEGEYIYGDNSQYDTVDPRRRRAQAAAATTASASKKVKTNHHRNPTPQEVVRQAHNKRVQTSKGAKQGLRRAFLKQNAAILKPFLEDQVYQGLEDANVPNVAKIPPTVVLQPKIVTGGTLRDYQLEGLQFMVNHHRRNLGMILGDEMGLGKTVQTISLLSYLKETEKKVGPSLVVCPLSVLSSWMKELAFWAPLLKVFRLHNSGSQGQEKGRQVIMDSVVEYDVILTTYEMVKTPHLRSLFSRLHFHYMVLDEGHKVKCNETLIADAVRKIHCENRLLLTGTPLQNNLVELWSLLELLYPEVFTTKSPFERSFNLSENHVDAGMLVKAQKLLELFMIRRLKSRVEKLLPPCLETRVYCPLSKEQVFLYKAILMKDLSMLERVEQKLKTHDGKDDEEEGIPKSHCNLLQNLFMQLRKVSQHPWMFDGMQGPDSTLKDMVAASGKLAVMDMLLISLCNKGHRCVIFSQFTMTLDVLEDYCLERGWNYARFDGCTSRAKRDYLVNRFNENESPFFLFLMSTKSGGIGLNLQSADTCILYDSDWNPQNDLQAMARVHRIGQKKTVHVFRLITSNSVEERMVKRANKKLLLDHSVNRECASADITPDDSGGLGVKDMLKDIKFGANAIFGEQTLEQLPSWEDIDEITNRQRKVSDSLGKLRGRTEENEAIFDAEKEFSASHIFGGIDYRQVREEHKRKCVQETPKNLRGIGLLWQSIKAIEGKKRVKKSRLVLVDGHGSGYGKSDVPILASNNYDLQSGESSVFGRELSRSQKIKAAVPAKKQQIFENADYCQTCLDGGELVLCPRCPVSLHVQCCGLKRTNDFMHCSHHRCTTCNKNLVEAGGLLYPCTMCPWSYCEDCLPVNNEGFRYLGPNERWEALGFDSSRNAVYIHCSAECEEYARKEFKWKHNKNLQVSPQLLDVTFNFAFQTDKVNLGVAHEEVQHPSLPPQQAHEQGSAASPIDLSESPNSKLAPGLNRIGTEGASVRRNSDGAGIILGRKTAAVEVSSSSDEEGLTPTNSNQNF